MKKEATTDLVVISLGFAYGKHLDWKGALKALDGPVESCSPSEPYRGSSERITRCNRPKRHARPMQPFSRPKDTRGTRQRTEL